MFIGRKNELKIIKDELKNNSSTIMVYGKRKIGKTTLIKEACKDSDKTFIYFECIKDSVEENVNLFMYQLKRLKLIDQSLSLESLDFISLFSFLNNLNTKLIVVIDEYPYLKALNNSQKIDSIFQSIIDNHIDNINLFISGSHIGMMNSLLKEKNALYGRFDQIIELEELNYLEAAEFYKDKSPYEKVEYYSIFGGSPYVLSSLDYSKSLKENIIKSFLDIKNCIYIYSDNFLLTDYINHIQSLKLLSFLKNGKHKYSEIEQSLDQKRTGNLTRILKPLVEMKLINKRYPINKPDNKHSYYEINDNVLRFFNTYIVKNKSLIIDSNPEVFYEEYIKPTLNHFVSLRFEQIVNQYFKIQLKNNLLKDALNVGTYYYDDKVNKINGEFDIAILKNHKYDILEVKFLTKPLTNQQINHEIKQIKAIKEIKINQIGFVSISGFEKDVSIDGYLIGPNELYSIK